MSRIREEAQVHTTADATARGLALTGHVITSAGLILAGTFGALLFAPLRSLQQYGFAVTVGILLDTFVVRSLLVPSIAVILGRHNWWPSRRAHAS
jgi:RND superfamily putative drug exporter